MDQKKINICSVFHLEHHYWEDITFPFILGIARKVYAYVCVERKEVNSCPNLFGPFSQENHQNTQIEQCCNELTAEFDNHHNISLQSVDCDTVNSLKFET